MKRICLLILISLWFNTSKSQVQDVFFNASESIKSDDLKAIVYTLASPDMGGRGVGTEGIQKAASYIAKSFQRNRIGHLPVLKGYYQEVDFSSHRLEKPIVTIGDHTCTEYKDFIGTLSTISSNRAFDIVAVQNISLEFIQGLDFKDKAILVLTSDIFFDKKPLYDLLIRKGCRGVILCNPGNQDEFNDVSKVYSSSGKKREKYKIAFSGSVSKTDSLLKSLKFKSYYISTLVVSPRAGSKIFGIDSKTLIKKLTSTEADSTFLKTAHAAISVKQNLVHDSQTSNNVLGYLEGSDLRNEVVVISAHYDHLGVKDGKIMYGADDNASGVAAVLEIAEAYSLASKQGFKPRRSILFAAFSAEESGLWGSRNFVNKIDSLKLKPIVDINSDMIGRGEDSRMELNSKVKKVYVISAKQDSLLVNKIKSIHLGIDSLRTVYSTKELYSSDQASFIQKGIPAVMFFRGLHPDYHTVNDTPDKLDYATMEKIARLVFKLSWDYSR